MGVDFEMRSRNNLDVILLQVLFSYEYEFPRE
jgi:hypothetical protein